jgi:hypothetical protein
MLNYINHDVQHAMKYVLKETKAKRMMTFQSQNDENSCRSKEERKKRL